MSQTYRKQKAGEKLRSEVDQDFENSEARLLPYASFLVGLCSLILYLSTLYPSVGPGDAGELTAASCTFGVPHPPGYPLYTFLTYLMIKLLPFHSIAWRANLFSALCHALAASVLFLTTARMSRSIGGGILAAGLFAFSPLVWRCSSLAEVFGLNTLFFSILLWSIATLERTKSTKIAYFGALLLGLAVSHHTTIVVFGGIYAVFVLYLSYANKIAPKNFVLKCLGWFTLGLLPYIYLPIASARHGLASWGDQTTLSGFLVHIFRAEYGSLRLSTLTDLEGSVSASFFEKILIYVKDLFRQLLYVGPLLAGFGLKQKLKDSKFKWTVLFTLISFTSYVVIFHALASYDLSTPLWYFVIPRFWILPNLLVCLWLGLGFAEATERLDQSRKKRVAGSLAILAVGVQVFLHYREVDRSNDHTLERYGVTILNSVPNRAILLAYGDQEYHAASYLQNCEGLRPDVILLNQGTLYNRWNSNRIRLNYPEIKIPDTHHRTQLALDSFNLYEFLSANLPQFSVFAIPGLVEDGSLQDRVEYYPYGLISKVVLKGTQIDLPSWEKESQRSLSLFDLNWIAQPRDVWEQMILDSVHTAYDRRATRLLELGLDAEATNAYSELIRLQPNTPDVYFYNLGFAYYRLLQKDKGNQHLRDQVKEAWTQYLNRNPEKKDQATQVRGILQNLQKS